MRFLPPLSPPSPPSLPPPLSPSPSLPSSLPRSYDIPCIPHGSSIYSYHLQFACAQSPLAELLIMSPNADQIVPYFGNLFLDEPLPIDGYIDLDPTKPGMYILSFSLSLSLSLFVFVFLMRDTILSQDV